MKKTIFAFKIMTVAILSGIFLSQPCHARVSHITVESEGNGSSAKAAIFDALTQAIGQVNGMELASETAYKIQEVTASTQDDESYFASEAFEQKITSATKGQVKEYRVLDLKKDPGFDNVWVARIQASIAKFQVSEQVQRLRLALCPFKIGPHVADTKRAAQYEDLFTQSLVSYLTQTRKFAILDRDYIAEQSKELDMIQDADFSSEEMAKLGNKVGTDYLIVGTVEAFSSKRWAKIMKSTGKKFPMYQFAAGISYRIIDVATGQVKISDSHSQSKSGQGNGADPQVSARKAAEAVGQKIINAIYPIVVASVRGETIFLAQGGGTMSVGQKMALIQYGEPIIDPYTKESLGREEIEIGMVEVTGIQSKMAKAKVLTSSVDLASEFAPKSFIVRPVKNVKKTAAKPQKKVKKTLKADIDDFEKDNNDNW